MGITYLESKWLQKLTGIREEVLYELFLYLQKVYDSIDRERYMEVLVVYGFGSRTEGILRHY